MDQEFFVYLEDGRGTSYCADIDCFDDLQEARLYAKSCLKEDIFLVKIIDSRGAVIDYFD